jgi:hypothetical protein
MDTGAAGSGDLRGIEVQTGGQPGGKPSADHAIVPDRCLCPQGPAGNVIDVCTPLSSPEDFA